MKKVFVAFAAVLMLAGCGSTSRLVANATGYSRSCINHISYLQFPSGVTPEINPETDKPLHC